MTRILALDLGTACGWARNTGDTVRHDEAAALQYGTFDLRAGRFSGGGMRFVRFEQELNNFVGLIDQVVFEEVRRHRGTDAAHVYGGLLAVLTAWCEKNSIPYEGVPVQAIKKFISGSGNADKETVIKAVKGRGYSPTDDNQADAIALLLLRLSEIAPRDNLVPVPESRREVAAGARVRAARR
jgi:Holliday junction resolvasome RuvABC endonuclease subunit